MFAKQGMTFWEVGARFGYYSIGLAQLADSVVAFEGHSDWASYIERSADENGFDHVDVITGLVGEDVHLDEFEHPDLVLMDVDGNEYDVLETAHNTIRSEPVWIIEVNYTDNHQPDEIEEMFQDEGYSIDGSDYPPRSDDYHILATPD